MPHPLLRFSRPALVATLALGLAACASPRPAESASSSTASSSGAPSASSSASSSRPSGTSAARRPAGPTYAVGTDPAAETRLAAAVAQYQGADFEAAAAAFDAYAGDTAMPMALRADALRYLGRTHTALGDEAAAADAMTQLILLEPPVIELDPDVEPPPLVQSYYAARLAHDGDYGLRTSRAKTLAILDFSNGSITDHEAWEPMTRGFSSLVIYAMGGATDLKLVERERVQWLLDEQDLATAGRVDAATAARAGKLLGVQHAAIGSFIVNGKELLLGIRLVDVETGEIVLSERVKGTSDDFDELVENLSLQLARAVNVELDPETETGSLDAALSYSEGLALIEQGDYSGAHAKFVKALEHDPTYGRAREKAESLRPLLAAR